MNLLFFDTESANCFDTYKMCEFGMVMCDEDFILKPEETRDILIHPGLGKEGRFYLAGRNGHADLKLAHEEREYRAQELYPAHYETIKNLLLQENTLVFGWAVDNDLTVLLDQSKRYPECPKYDLTAFDIQTAYMLVFESSRRPNLADALASFSLSEANSHEAHRPDEDALMSLLVLKHLCEKTGLDVLSFVKTYAKASRNAFQEAIDKEEAKKIRQAIQETEAILHRDYYDDPSLEEDDNYEKGFSLSRLTKAHQEEAITLVRGALRRGYSLKRFPENGQYLVCFDEEEKKEATERDRAETPILYADFLSLYS